jgi:hypothetical protein
MNKDYINYQEAYPNIEKALKEGARLYAFLSGGGLRVVRIEKGKVAEAKDNEDDNLISYGEHPYFPGALAHAEQDFGLTYEQQYSGENALHKHYLTGAYPIPYDAFDVYLKYGRSLDVFYNSRWGQFICTTPVPYNMHRNNEILWGSSIGFLGAIVTCLLSFQFEDKEEFEKRLKE